jgi:hypothetical protein
MATQQIFRGYIVAISPKLFLNGRVSAQKIFGGRTMQNKTKRLSVLLGLALGAPAVVAPVVMPSHAPAAMAQESAEYPDVPQNHWAYDAINKLSQAGIIEGMPNGTYMGNKPMTRYEFAVAVARILDKIGGTGAAGTPGAPGTRGPQGERGPVGPAGQIPDVSNFVKRKDLQDAINALRNEFAPELKALGVRVDDLDKRVTDIENRLAKPPKLTITPSMLFRAGSSNYNLSKAPAILSGQGGDFEDDFFNTQHQYSYMDFSLRLADRVSDNVTLNAEIRSLTGNQEDPLGLINNIGELAGGIGGTGGLGGLIGLNTNLYLRQANAVVDLNHLKLIAGRQHTKVAQGLLYDNDYLPTDQFQGIFSIGPVNVDAFIGSTNNNLGVAPYQLSGPALVFAALGGPNGYSGFPSYAGSGGIGGIGNSVRLEDSESLVHGSVDLFKISGKPVQLGASYLFSGVADQKGWGADLTLPLFNRNVGIEYVNQKQYADGTNSNGAAYNITVPVLRTKSVDLDVAYGKANDDYEYFLSSAANPYVRSWGEAVFDRPMALGAPLINSDSSAGPLIMAVKKAWDINGTLRFIKKFPITLRWYNAKGSNDVDLGNVWSVGTNYQLTHGLDLELKYGQYNPKGDVESLKYFRIGANVGF